MIFSAAHLLQLSLCIASIDALSVPKAVINTVEDRDTSGDDNPTQGAPAVQEPVNLPPSAFVSLTGLKTEDGKFIVQPDPEGESDGTLDKRQNPAVVAIAGPVFNVVASATAAAIHAAIGTLVAMAFWNPVREAFTRRTVRNMWERNPDPGRFAAAICYNQGYGLQRENGIDGRLSASLRLAALSTDYDCMYMEGNNQFYTRGDGGYINLAYHYDTSRCTFIQDNGDLHCT